MERALGGELAARDLCRALSPATIRACERIAALGGDRDLPPATCIRIAMDEGASIEAVLALVVGYRPEEGEGDPEVRAAVAIALALAAS